MWKAIHRIVFGVGFGGPAGAGHARTRPPGALTSDHGWDVAQHRDLLKESIQALQSAGMRVSLFTGTEEADIEAAAAIGTDRIELYTEPYAREYAQGRPEAVVPFARAATLPHACGLGVNAGHDLDANNLRHFAANVPYLQEVSIGHALISKPCMPVWNKR